jgi:hypothetical protein
VTPSISSNGNVAGTAILWAIQNGWSPLPAIVYAIDATNVSTELWDSTQAPGNRDMAGAYVKFSVPTVANGKVYVGTANLVDVYGLFQGQATLSSPAPGTTLPGPVVNFTWQPGTGATGFKLWLGSTGAGSSNLYNSGTLSPGTFSETVTLPTNGVTIYARFWSMVSGAWQYLDYTFTAAAQAVLTTPAPATVLAGAVATFTWTAGTGNTTGYSLWLGSTGVGSNNLYQSATTTATSVKTSSLPTNGETVYAHLITYINGGTVSNDYTYTAAARAVLTTPAPVTVLAGPKVTFTWKAGTGNTTGYSLWLGSTGVGSSNLYHSGATTATSVTASGLPTNGETVYARLYTYINGVAVFTDYTYTAAAQAMPAVLTTPAPATVLAGTVVTFTWTAGTGDTTGYSLWLGSTGVGSSNLYHSGTTTATSVKASGLPTNGETVYARLITYINGGTVSTDYTYSAAAQAVLTTPAPFTVLAGPKVTFTWKAGTGNTTGYSLWLGSTGVGSDNLYHSGATTATSVTASGLPTNGETVYARLYTYINGVTVFTDYTYTAAAQAMPAVVTTPAPATVLAGTVANFAWTAGTGSFPAGSGLLF